jgi:hypothetical protein
MMSQKATCIDITKQFQKEQYVIDFGGEIELIKVTKEQLVILRDLINEFV